MATKARNYRKQGSKTVANKEAQKYVGIGRSIVATETRAEGTVRDALIACLGFTPEQIASVKTGIKEAYKTRLESQYTSTEVQSTGDFQMQRQAIYNRQSEKIAVLESFRIYAAWSSTERKAFDSAIADCQGYHSLVSLCRACVATEKNGGTFVPADVARAKNAVKIPLKSWTSKIKSSKDSAALVELRQAINERLAMLKPKSNVVSLSAKRKARKAVARKSLSTTRAVNRLAA